jgi:hypothetical protein
LKEEKRSNNTATLPSLFTPEVLKKLNEREIELCEDRVEIADAGEFLERVQSEKRKNS